MSNLPDDEEYLRCPGCDTPTSDGERCGECISELCEYYEPDEQPEPAALSDTMTMFDIIDEGGQA